MATDKWREITGWGRRGGRATTRDWKETKKRAQREDIKDGEIVSKKTIRAIVKSSLGGREI